VRVGVQPIETDSMAEVAGFETLHSGLMRPQDWAGVRRVPPYFAYFRFFRAPGRGHPKSAYDTLQRSRS
jgi:hypothetical protein